MNSRILMDGDESDMVGSTMGDAAFASRLGFFSSLCMRIYVCIQNAVIVRLQNCCVLVLVLLLAVIFFPFFRLRKIEMLYSAHQGY